MIEHDRIQVNSLAGGISKQAAHLRFPDQVGDAVNIDFDIVEGARKRSGTRMGWTLDDPAPASASTPGLHVINRDATERYIVVYYRDSSTGNFNIQVFDTDGTQADVTITSAADAYLDLNDAEASDLRLITAADVTLIVNTTVQAVTDFTDNFTITETFDDTDEMERHRGTDNAYYAVGSPATRWFRYDVDSKNVAQVQFATISDYEWTNPMGNWDDPSTAGGAFESPFKLSFVAKRTALSLTNAAWNETNKTLTLAGAFTNYEHVNGDRIKLTDGTGMPGAGATVKDTYAEIVSKDSDDQITLGDNFFLTVGWVFTYAATTTGGGNQTDWDADGVYHFYSAQIEDDSYDDIDAVMAAFTEQFRTAPLTGGSPASSTHGNEDIGLNWTSTGTDAGYAIIVAPFRGSDADDVRAVDFVCGGDYALNQSTGPFYSPHVSGVGADPTTVTSGNGTLAAADSDLIPVDVDDPDTRWVEVSEPGSADAGLNEGTLPIKMTRTTLSPLAFTVDVVDWNARASGNSTNNESPGLFKDNTREGLIEAITADTPGEITSTSHGLTTGDVIQLIDTDSTPSLDGERTVTRIDDDTFSVGVNTSGAGTADTGSWRQGGTKIKDAEFLQDRLFFVGGEYIAGSQTGDLFNFYAANATVASDADPIGKRVGGSRVADLFAIVPFRQTLLLFSTTGQQFEVSSEGPFTPTSVRSDPTTNVRTVNIEPAVMGNFVYFPSPDGSSTALHEYLFDETQLSSVTGIVSAHYQGGLPSGITSIDADAATRRVVMLKEDTRNLHVYRPFWSGNQKVQSAWSVWQFSSDYSIWGARFLDDKLWLLVEAGGTFALEWIPTRPLGPETDFPYEVHGDRQMVLTGTASGTDTVYDVSAFFSDAADSTINRLVKGNDFSGVSGSVITGGASNGWTYVGTDITVDEAAFLNGEVILCTFYDASITITRPFRSDNGVKMIGDELLHEEMTVSFRDSGLSQVRIDPTGNFATLEAAFSGDNFYDVTSGTIRVPVRQNADKVAILIGSGDVYPMTVNGLEHDVSAETGMRGRQ